MLPSPSLSKSAKAFVVEEHRPRHYRGESEHCGIHINVAEIHTRRTGTLALTSLNSLMVSSERPFGAFIANKKVQPGEGLKEIDWGDEDGNCVTAYGSGWRAVQRTRETAGTGYICNERKHSLIMSMCDVSTRVFFFVS